MRNQEQTTTPAESLRTCAPDPSPEADIAWVMAQLRRKGQGPPPPPLGSDQFASQDDFISHLREWSESYTATLQSLGFASVNELIADVRQRPDAYPICPPLEPLPETPAAKLKAIKARAMKKAPPAGFLPQAPDGVGEVEGLVMYVRWPKAKRHVHASVPDEAEQRGREALIREQESHQSSRQRTRKKGGQSQS
jgi:hypothetical protein